MSEVVRTAGQGSWEQLYGYSRAIQVGPWVMTSGCTAMVEGAVTHVNDTAGQTKAAFRVALDHLVEAGAGLSDVVRTRMYIVDPDSADAVGRAHGEMFGLVKPVAIVVPVPRLLHPDVLVSVEVEAYRAPSSAEAPQRGDDNEGDSA